MKFKKIILLIFLISTFTDSIGQSQIPLAHGLYTVDKQIDLHLKNVDWSDTGTLKNSMSIKVFRGTSTFFDESLDCYTQSILRNDTIYIFGHMIGELGWGFKLVLFKDSYIVASFGLSDGKIYKQNNSDTDSTDYILLPSTSQTVTLSKRPLFHEGETVAGKVEIKSIPYYYTNWDDKFRIELTAYFKTAALKRSN